MIKYGKVEQKKSEDKKEEDPPEEGQITTDSPKTSQNSTNGDSK